jgi:peptide chain release factor 1
MDGLRARLLGLRVQEQQDARAKMRRSQVGSGDRSEKIRTYNFPQSRVTDHRIGWSTHDLQGFLDGDIGPLIEALKLADVEEQLSDEP